MTNKRTLADWFLATRPWSYPASTMPVALVLAYYFADGVAVDPVNAGWALVNIVIFHAAGNVWSDYFDFRYGVDNQNTLGVRQLVDGKFVAREFLWFAIFLFFRWNTVCALSRLANGIAVSGGDFCGHCGGAGVSALEVSRRR